MMIDDVGPQPVDPTSRRPLRVAGATTKTTTESVIIPW